MPVVLALVVAALTVGAGTAYAAAPTAYDDSSTATTAQATPILLTAVDPDGDPLTFVVVTGPSHGTLTDCSTGDCTYTSSLGYTGPDSFTWKANDGAADSNTATFSLDVTAPGAPVAYDNSQDVGGDTTSTLTLSANDPAGAHLTFAIQSPPSHGSLTAIATPSCTGGFCEATVDYTPTAAYRGPDSFAFTASSPTQTSAPASFALNVVDSPCAGAVISNGTVQIGVNCIGDLNVGDVGMRYVPTNNDSTAPGCPCEGWGAADSVSNVTGFANQSAGNSDNLRLVSFTHDADSATSVVDIGTTYRVTHDYQPSLKTPNAYEVTVTVQNLSAGTTHLRYRRVMDWDIEPTAFLEYVTVNKGSSSNVVFTSDDGFATADALAGPSDLGSTGNFTDVGPADHGALFDFDFGTLAAGATKTFKTYYGAAGTEVAALDALNQVGAEAYSLGEPSTPGGQTLGTPNTFLFAFGSVGGTAIFAPNAVDDSLSTNVGTPGDVDVLTNDTDPNGDALTVTSKTDGAHGTVSCTSAGVCTYTPTGSYIGPDSFTYTVSDGHGGTATGTVNVTVNAMNHNPVGVTDSMTTNEDTAGATNVLSNDTDADGDTLTVTGQANGAHGTAICAALGVCTYTPAPNYHGPDSFTYTVGDGHGGTATGTVDVTVTSVNDKPVAVDDTASTAFETATVVGVLANDTDADGDLLTVTGMTDGAHGRVACTAGGSCTYTPDAGYSGADAFDYTVNDGHGGTDVGAVSVTVVAKPAAPDISVVKTPLASSVAVGNLTGYLLTVRNLSSVAAPAVSVSDALPTGFRFRDASGNPCVLVGGTLTCSFDLAAGASRQIQVNGAFVVAGNITNTATVGSAGDPNAGNDRSTTTTAVTGKSCTIVGTFGDDKILGTNKADVICGLSGNDRVNAKQGDDTIYGNDGNDRLMGLGGNDLVDGGPGNDTTLYSALLQAVRVSLGLHRATGQGTDTLVSIENVVGSGRADTLVGDSFGNVLSGLGGNDRLRGGAGNDTLLGGAGVDTCAQGSGHGRSSSC